MKHIKNIKNRGLSKFWTVLCMAIIGGMLHLNAQSPGVPYQAYIINSNSGIVPGKNIDVPLVNKELLLQFTITNSIGDVEYVEEILVTTDEFGMLSTVVGVGRGTAVFQTFDDIVWDGKAKKMNIKIDFSGSGDELVEHGEINLIYIPGPSSGASGTAGKFVDGTTAADAVITTGNVGIGVADPKAVLDVQSENSGIIVPRIANAAAVTTPVNGMFIYDLSLNCFNFYENDAWSGCKLNIPPSTSDILTQIGAEGDDPNAVNSVVTIVQLASILPALTGLDPVNETAYQDYIDANPNSFSDPATQAEVQAMVDAVNSAAVLTQIGAEGDDPNAVNSVVTIVQLASILPALTGLDPVNETAYQDYIDANPNSFSDPATQAEVQAMVDAVNAAEESNKVLAQIGAEGDDPDAVNSVVTVAQLMIILPALTDIVSANETAYQDYIDANPNSFSDPATQAEVQAMIDAFNTVSVLAQIGAEGDDPDAVNSVVTVAQLMTISPALTGLDLANEIAYQDYIDANPNSFSDPATQAQVQAMINTVNTVVVLAQIGAEGDDPDAVNSVVTVTQLAVILPAITGLVPANETAYQDYIDANPNSFSDPATQAEVQAMIDIVNPAEVIRTVLIQIGLEGDIPDTISSVVTVAQLALILPAITGLDPANETAYQDYIDANPDSFSAFVATQAEVQAMVDAVNTAEESTTVLAQIGAEGDDPDAVNSVVTVAELMTILPALTNLFPANETAYQDYIDANPNSFSDPATQPEVQAMLDIVNCNAASAATVIVEVAGANGTIWMDRNLGAIQAATSSDDAAAYGSYFQWGRASDGHECSASGTTTTLATTSTPGHSDFILVDGNTVPPFDWITPQDDTLWQGASGTNNPCPTGYRIPTEAEFNAEIANFSSQDTAGAFASNLKLPANGFRDGSLGTIGNTATTGYYWTSTVSTGTGVTRARNVNFVSTAGTNTAELNHGARSSGFAVRCIKN